MFILKNNWLTPDPEHCIFDFHLPGYPVVPGAISAGLIHQAYGEHDQNLTTTDVDIVFLKPITKDMKLILSINANLSELFDSNNAVLVKLSPSKSTAPPKLPIMPTIKKCASKITRPPELVFHDELSIHENIAECTIHYENLLKTKPYLSSLQYKNYFICLETMGNLAMELSLPKVKEIFVFHSFKGVWFDWQKITEELMIITSARRINSKLIQWSSQIKNTNQELVGYVNSGLNVLSSAK